MRNSWLTRLARILGMAVVAVVPLVGVVDGGSVGYARLEVTDDARTVGRVAAAAIRGMPLDKKTATIAYGAAQAAAVQLGATVDREGFRVLRGDLVTLTLRRTVPTLLVGHVPGVRDVAEMAATVTVGPSQYS